MVEAVAAVIRNDNGKILITKKNGVNSEMGLWEFPRQNIETGETDEEALTRGVKENLNLEISVNNYISEKTFKSSEDTINLIAYDAQIEYGNIKLMNNEEYKWINKEELNNYKFIQTDKFILKALNEDEE